MRSTATSGLVLLRADSAFYGHAVVAAAHRAGAKVSITARMGPAVKRAIAKIPDEAWTTIQYIDAIRDEATGTWISSGEVAEIPFTAFSSRKISERIPGRPVVRRIPELNPFEGDGQLALFDTHRFHAFFTTSDLDTVTADKTHRQHAIIEQVNADLKDSALAHLPSGNFTANAAWLVLATIAFNLSRAIGNLASRLGKSVQRHHPPQAHQHPGTDIDTGQENRAAPAVQLALGDRMDGALHGGLRPTTNSCHLPPSPTAQPGPGTPPAARPAAPPCPQPKT